MRLNNAIERIQRSAARRRRLPTLGANPKLAVIADASLANLEHSRTMGGRIVGLVDKAKNFNAILARAGKLARVATASFDAETIVAVDAVSDGIGVALLLEEFTSGPRPTLFEEVLRRELATHRAEGQTRRPAWPVYVCSDGNGTVTAVRNSKELACKRRQGDVASLREGLELGDIAAIEHIAGADNPADALTGSGHVSAEILVRLLEGAWPKCPW